MSPILKYITRNIGTRPFLSSLVFASMIVVSATLSGVSAVAAGLWGASKSTGHPTYVIVTTRGVILESDSSVETADLPTITTSSDVVRSSPEVLGRNHVVLNGALDFVMLRGVEPQAYAMHGVELIDGRMPTPGEPEMVVGEVVLQHFSQLMIGGSLEMMGMNFRVVGVFRAPGFTNGEAWTSRQIFRTNPKLNDLSSVYLETPSPEAAKRLAEQLSTSRAIQVEARIEPDFYGAKVREFDFLIRGLMLLFSLVATGAVLSAASLLSVLQLRRLSEQAVMRSMGFRVVRIATMMIGETLLLVVPGGLCGVALSWFVLRNYVVTALAPSMAMVMYRAPLTPPLAAFALGGMVVIGLIGSVAPIVRMARTEITRGLREE